MSIAIFKTQGYSYIVKNSEQGHYYCHALNTWQKPSALSISCSFQIKILLHFSV